MRLRKLIVQADRVKKVRIHDPMTDRSEFFANDLAA